MYNSNLNTYLIFIFKSRTLLRLEVAIGRCWRRGIVHGLTECFPGRYNRDQSKVGHALQTYSFMRSRTWSMRSSSSSLESEKLTKKSMFGSENQKKILNKYCFSYSMLVYSYLNSLNPKTNAWSIKRAIWRFNHQPSLRRCFGCKTMPVDSNSCCSLFAKRIFKNKHKLEIPTTQQK